MPKLTAEMISPELLKNQAGIEIYHQGQLLFRWGKVVIDKVLEDSAHCRVNNNRAFNVEINLTDRFLYLKCDCKFASKGKLCEHDVAAALAVQEYLRKNHTNRWQYRINKVLQTAQNTTRKTAHQPFLLFFSLQNASNLGMLNWKIIPYQLPLSNLPKETRAQADDLDSQGIQSLLQKQPGIVAHVKSPYHALEPEACVNCSKDSVILANLLIERNHTPISNSAFPIQYYLSLLASSNSPVVFGTTIEPIQKNLHINLNPAEIQLLLEQEDNGLRISASVSIGDNVFPMNTGGVQVIASNPFLLLVDDIVVQITDENHIELLKNFSESPQIFISSEDIPEFMDKFYLSLAQHVNLSGEHVTWESSSENPTRRLYLSENKGELLAQLRFSYGDYEVSYDSRYPDFRIVRKPGTWTSG